MTVQDPVQEIKNRLDLVQVIGRRVSLRRAGRDWKGLCPFHQERTPSFVVHPHEQYWHCFGCDRSGDLFGFVMEIEGTDFRGALEALAAEAGIEVGGGRDPERSRRRQDLIAINRLAEQFFRHVLLNLPAGGAGRRFLEDRGVGDEVAEKFGLGFAPSGRTGDNLYRFLTSRGQTVERIGGAGLAHTQPGRRPLDRFRERLMFPIRDPQGRTLGFAGRLVGPAGPRDAKYVNTPDTELFHKGEVVFGLDLARDSIRAEGRACLVEGQLDCVSAHQAGLGSVVATGGTAVTAAQVGLLHRYAPELVIALDSDDAGHKATLRTIEVAAAAGVDCRVLRLPGAKDPDEFLRSGRPDPAGEFRALAAEAPREWSYWIDAELDPLDLSGPDGRREGARRVTSLLGRIPQAATREIHAQEAARRLGVSVANLLGEAKLSPAPAVLNREAAPARLTRRGIGYKKGSRSVEMLLGILATHPELVASLEPGMENEMPEPGAKEAFGVLCRLAQEGARPDEELALVSDAGRPWVEAAARWRPPRTGWGPEPARETLDECVRTLRRARLETELRELTGRLREAEAGPEAGPEAEQLRLEVNQLTQRLRANGVPA
ncbi:MAG: DNA primase [Candidatus Dormibacteria bacterium]